MTVILILPCFPGSENLSTSRTGGIKEAEVQVSAGGTERTVQGRVGDGVVAGAGRVVLLQGQAGLGGAGPGCWHLSLPAWLTDWLTDWL